jgi:S1-C subfamily serine protease
MMRACLVVVWFLSLGCTYTSQARDVPYADAVAFLGMEESAKQLKTAVCAVQIPGNQTNEDKKDDWVSLGTGFLVSGDRTAVLAVTCKHVVEAASKEKKQPFIGLDTELGYRRFPCKVAFIDPTHDIAILAPQRGDNEDVKLQSKRFAAEMFDDGSSLVEGRGVLIPGYPLSLGVEDDENHPVMRFGIVAQYTGKDYFLVDGVASHGNSGSPVLALKHKENRLVGMITSHVADSTKLFNEKGQLTARFPYNSGLARGVTMRAIVAAIQKAKY